MDLYACTGCGVVLDRSVMTFPRDIHNENPDDERTWGVVDTSKAVWIDDLNYVSASPCPVCGTLVPRRGSPS